MSIGGKKYKEVKYVGFYDLADSSYKRVSSPAAITKMDYISDAVIRAGWSVHLVSPSWYSDSAYFAPFAFSRKAQINKYKRVTFCPSVGTRTKGGRYFRVIISILWLLYWLIVHSKKGENILVYHSPWLSAPIRWARKIKGFRIILEAEEVYGDVSSIRPYFNRLEEKAFSAADAYLYSTELLISRIGKNKPYIVIYGPYVTYIRALSTPPDDKIHIVYAGIIDKVKAGAFKAIESAKYLPRNYLIHIIGFGQVDELVERINVINKESHCKIVFDGEKKGGDYVRYMQSCHIGLSTQNMSGKYAVTSFPSKILSYLGLGLSVISGRISCVEASRLSPLISYYENDSPESIAEAILRIDFDRIGDYREVIAALDNEFVIGLKALLLRDY